MRACAQFLRRAWPGIWHGLALGCLAAFLGSLLFSLVVVSYPCYDEVVGLSARWRPDYQFWLGLGLLAGWGWVLAFVFAAVPGALGGAVIGLALHNEVHGPNSLGVPGVLVGGLAGACAMAAILLALYAWAGIPPWDPDPLWEPWLPWGIAIAAGAWVGRWLERYEERRRASGPDGWRTGAPGRTRG
jgi:hypothetical protein